MSLSCAIAVVFLTGPSLCALRQQCVRQNLVPRKSTWFPFMFTNCKNKLPSGLTAMQWGMSVKSLKSLVFLQLEEKFVKHHGRQQQSTSEKP